MRLLLRLDFFVYAAELVLNALNLMPRGFALPGIQLYGSGPRQPTIRTVHNCGDHLQIA
jgi:hypothetical protein